MKYLAYIKGFNAPTIQHFDRYNSLGKIVGGQFRKDGSLLLHTFGSRDEVMVIQTDIFPVSLEDALEKRQHEIENHSNPYGMISNEVNHRIVSKPDAVLWALELDPE